MKTYYFVYAAAFLCCAFAQQRASGLSLGDLADAGANVGRTLEEVYTTTTRPLRDVSSTMYEHTIRNPFNEFKEDIEKNVPEKVRQVYKDEFERRFKPLSDFAWDATTGKKTVSDAGKEAFNEYYEQAKELLICPALYVLYSSAKAASEPVPPELLDRIARHWGGLTNRQLHREARYLVSSDLIDTITNGTAEGITFYDVILFRDDLTNRAKDVALLAHELVHVDQYHELSFSGFIAKYFIGGKMQTGRNNSMEEEAYSLGDRILRLLSEEGERRSYPTPRSSYVAGSHAVAGLAALSAAGASADIVLPTIFMDAIARNSKSDAKIVASFGLTSTDISQSAKAALCRTIASGNGLGIYAPSETLNWAKQAVVLEGEKTYNWFFLARSAFLAADRQTEYDALIVLASMMLGEEIPRMQGGMMTMRMIGAEQHLCYAIFVGNMIGPQSGTLYDNRVPFVLLSQIGLELRPTARDDNALLVNAQNALGLDVALNKRDYWHFAVLDVVTAAKLRVGRNQQFLPYILECENFCKIALEHFRQSGAECPDLEADYQSRMTDRLSSARSIIQSQRRPIGRL